MMAELGPCGPTSNWVVLCNAILNTFQVIVLAMLAQRAVRKNREEAAKRRDDEP